MARLGIDVAAVPLAIEGRGIGDKTAALQQ
jgi:hypothetical protein